MGRRPFMAVASLSSRFAALSRKIVQPPLLSAARFFTAPLPGDAEPLPDDQPTSQQRLPFQRPLENGLDPGVYKAVMVGKVGQKPVQKHLKSGRSVVLFSLGTGGIRNNRRPLDNEQPREYAERCAVQWHRVCVYPERLGDLALKHVNPGSVLYLEGNLETKVFSDPTTGLVRRIREIAIRRDGRLVFLGAETEAGQSQPQQADLRSAGYY
ncbi:single-stranded DNA-binding protein, mitochondrial-like [Dioscorea cayenensis subsp. rotundata]|uniref:Single-stranded DNA-binding protein, mitochondrial-like n=1 Tax=Dioscorea cayennensis subsp. rotundata TaxID=55577 RepID=A0AB40AXA6_DIOCR|nr:single-stranded DNA-binding protein, mitochondrial-like [Dioscorea cayenensis subsp. rotundata]